MTEQTPAPAPPDELVAAWRDEWEQSDDDVPRWEPRVARLAAAWGYRQGLAESDAKAQAAADAELEACCEWLFWAQGIPGSIANDLRAARRPKPPSLKQEGMRAVNFLFPEDSQAWEAVALRRALESIPDEDNQ